MFLILQTQIVPNWRWTTGTSVGYARVFCSEQFFEKETGLMVPQGQVTNINSACAVYDCTISGSNFTLPEITLASTTDSMVQNATYTIVLYDNKNVPRYPLASNIFVDPEFFQNPLTSSVTVTDAFTNAANGIYTWRGIHAGKAYYNLDTFDDSITESAIVWSAGNSHWEILATNGDVYYYTAATSDFPWEATTWLADTGLLPVPYVLERTVTVSSTWEMLIQSNQGFPPNAWQNLQPTWDVAQIKQYVDRVQTPIPYSSSLIAGKLYIDPDPDLSTHPIAVGINNARWAGRKYLSDYHCDIAEAIEAIGSEVCELVITCACTVSEDATIPSTMLITMEGKGKFTVLINKTLRINSFSPVGDKQWFFGDGDVILGKNAVNPIHLSWWAGVFVASDIDSTHAFEQWRDSLNLQGTTGGGTGVIGPGVWCCTELTLPNAAFIQGAGHDPDGDSFSANYYGTVIRLFDETAGYLWKLPTGFRNITIQDMTLTTGDAVTANCIYNDITTTSDGFTARRVSFQSTYSRATIGAQASTAALVFWSGSGGQQSTNNLFELCWWQVPINGTGFYCDTPNTSFTFDTCSPQCLTGSTWLHPHNAGPITEINSLGQGVDDFTGLATVTNRTIAAASVVRIVDQVSPAPFSTLTLKADTPSDKQFTVNDIFRRVNFTGAGFTGAYITEIQSPFIAILSFYPSAPITEQPCTVLTFTDCPNTAYAMRIGDGNVVSWNINGGIDEGFNFSLQAGCGTFSIFTFTNYYGQGRVEYSETCAVTSISSRWPAYAFEDTLGEQALQLSLIGDNVFSNLWVGGLLFAQTPGVWRIQRVTDNVSSSYTPQTQAIFPAYDMTDGTYDFVNPIVSASQQQMYADYGVTNSEPVLSLTTKQTHGTVDDQKTLLWIGHQNFLTDDLELGYSHLRNEVSGRYELTGNQTGQGGLVGLNFNGDIYCSNFRGGTIYPAEITGNQSAYAGGVGPNDDGLYDVRNIRVTTNADNLHISGITLDYTTADGTPPDGTPIRLTNNGTHPIALTNNDAATTDARIRLRTCTGQTLILEPGCSANLVYNVGAAGAVERWDTSLDGVPFGPIFRGPIQLGDEVTLGTTGAVPMNCSLASCFAMSITGNVTLTPTNLAVGTVLLLNVITTTTNAYTITFASPFKTVGGTLVTSAFSGVEQNMIFKVNAGFAKEFSRSGVMS